MRKVFGVLSAASFMYALGTVGGIECDTIPLGAGFLRTMIALALFALFAWFAGAYDYDTSEDDHD